MNIAFYDRDFEQVLNHPDVQINVQNVSWAAMGGPKKCVFEVTGRDVWEMIERLRFGIEVFDDRQEQIWWGYVSKVDIFFGRLILSVDLETFANKIRVIYSAVNVAGSIGEQSTTPWAENTDSSGEYGTKEKSISLSEGTDEQAENARDTALNRLKYPLPAIQMGNENKLRARVTCEGWWKTLGWKYYANGTGKEGYEESGTGTKNFGDATARTKVAQSFQLASAADWTAQTIRVKIKKVEAPTDNITVALCADSSDTPGSVLASATLSADLIGDYFDWYEFTLSSRVQLSAATTYWITISRSGANNSTNYFAVDANEDLGYTRGLFRVWNGSAWVASDPDVDMLFAVAGVAETSAQIEEMITTTGQFVTAVDNEVSSGVYSSPYRDGTRLGLDQIMELLVSGTDNQLRMLAVMDINRRVRMYEEPQSGSKDYLLTSDGKMRDYLDKELMISQIRPGVWVRLKDAIPGTVDMDKLADPTLFFLEEVELDVTTGRISFVPRDQNKLLNLGGLQ